MKKHIWKRLAALSVVLLMAFAAACAPSEKMEKRVYDYLENKYGDWGFELLDYTQDKATNGGYTVNARCGLTGVDFEIYVTSLLITDSYYVRSANATMDAQLLGYFEGKEALTGVSDIQWLDIYEDNSGGYRFREPDDTLSDDPQGVTDIYRIYLTNVPSANEAAQCIIMTLSILNANNVHLDSVTFDFELDGEQMLFVTDTDAVLSVSADSFAALEQMLMPDGNTSNLMVNIFYESSSVKVIEFHGEESLPETIPEE